MKGRREAGKKTREKEEEVEEQSYNKGSSSPPFALMAVWDRITAGEAELRTSTSKEGFLISSPRLGNGQVMYGGELTSDSFHMVSCLICHYCYLKF